MSKELSVDIQEVKKMVKEKGMTRDEIAAELGISKKACREQIFSHPELKGIRKPQAPKGVKITLTGASEGTDTKAAPAKKEAPVAKEEAETTEEVEETAEKTAEANHTPHYSADDEETEETEEETEDDEESEEEETDEEETTDTTDKTYEDKPASGVEW